MYDFLLKCSLIHTLIKLINCNRALLTTCTCNGVLNLTKMTEIAISFNVLGAFP